MAPTDPPWKAAATVPGLKIAPSNIAESAAATEFQVAESAAPGAEKNDPQACSTVVSLNAIIRPPTTSAAKIARIVTTAWLPSMIAVMTARPYSAARDAAGLAVPEPPVACPGCPSGLGPLIGSLRCLGPCSCAGFRARGPGAPVVTACAPVRVGRHGGCSRHAVRSGRLRGPGRLLGRAGHQQAELGCRDRRRAEPGDPALIHHGDAVGERVDLVELGGDDHDCHPAIALLDQAAVHELDRADVETAGGLAGKQQPDVPADLASQDDLLLVAAGQRADGGVDRGGAHVELGNAVTRMRPDRGEVEGHARGVRLPVVHVEDEVVGHGELAHQAILLAVLGDVPDAGSQPVPRAGIADVAAAEPDRPGGGHQAHQRLAQLGLPVALHAGDPEYLAR